MVRENMRRYEVLGLRWKKERKGGEKRRSEKEGGYEVGGMEEGRNQGKLS